MPLKSKLYLNRYLFYTRKFLDRIKLSLARVMWDWPFINFRGSDGIFPCVVKPNKEKTYFPHSGSGSSNHGVHCEDKTSAANNPSVCSPKAPPSSLLHASVDCNSVSKTNWRQVLSIHSLYLPNTSSVLREATVLFRILPSWGYLFTRHSVQCLHVCGLMVCLLPKNFRMCQEKI